MHILDYLEKIPATEEGKIFHYLHNILSTYPDIVPKVHFNTPFYTRNRWLAYLSTQKKGGVELCFVHANQFSKHLKKLDFKKRKQVGGITYLKVEEINVDMVDKLMQEALKVDEKIIPVAKRRLGKRTQINMYPSSKRYKIVY
jgi:uncharacterized protein YdhG (YjbR/CyaY superfamily)